MDDAAYKKIRWQIIITTFLTYTVMYISRKAFAAAAPLLMHDIGMTAVQFGTASSIYYILYGISKFGSGLLADRINPRVFLAPVLLVIAIINVGVGMCNNVTILLTLYCLTAVAQGCGFPPIAKAISQWYSKSERGGWYSLWNTSHNVGGALAPLIASAVIAYTGNWRYAFFVPALITLIQAVISAIFMRDKPEKYGLPNVGVWKNDKKQLEINKHSETGLTIWRMFRTYILNNPIIWIAICGDLCIYVIRTVTDDWVSVYFVKELGWDLIKSNSLVAWFEVGGILGGLTSGIISDKIFHADRWVTILIYSVILLLGMGGVALTIHIHYYLVAICFFIIGAGIYAPQMLFALGVIEASHADGAGAATGLKGGVTYVGAALAGAPIAMIQKYYSWNGVFGLLGVIAVVLIVLTTCLIILEKRNKNKQVQN
ncbi:MFS transporter [Salmonella enterica]|uniref:MFS transporter n=4 Tax=Salmonella enterica TaxID=28901 RepID=A0A9Y2Y8X0_SALEB|nr:MFS transporter [Salmonella enterica subsp. enterica serovar Java]EAN9725281.1 MFS transporter [Salmonella enterica]EBU8673106.1 MFS transporter [Salmonella enterica subsp. enterica serovar Panama]EBV8393234.1 MFS transporter [Salmonella enterica subsp. enterica serovar Virchow]ECA3792257.1 MFS transporter [Salmonella enterica subsp. enterica serovar Aqua]ECF2799905.1 MFS transporter [Salmonella enterica subsp. enterica serovar Miami]EDD5836940.1 MFS transporter [Salmonella enterica subsp.